MGLRERLEASLQAGQDNALLRFSLGQLCLETGESEHACLHLAEALRMNPEHSASWKLYGRALEATGQRTEALAAFKRGLEVATRHGDNQAVRELQVFLRRLEQTN